MKQLFAEHLQHAVHETADNTDKLLTLLELTCKWEEEKGNKEEGGREWRDRRRYLWVVINVVKHISRECDGE